MKWISRKLFVAIAGVVSVLLAEKIGAIEAETFQNLVNILCAYLYGQAAVDVATQLKGKKLK